jgi:hypothetical protein
MDDLFVDPIVDEVRRIRDAHAAKFNYDLDAIFRDIKEQEKRWGLQFVNGVAKFTFTKNVPEATVPTASADVLTPSAAITRID